MASRIVQYFADKLKSMKEYPITLTKAVYDESGNRLDNKLSEIDDTITGLNSSLNETKNSLRPPVNEVMIARCVMATSGLGNYISSSMIPLLYANEYNITIKKTLYSDNVSGNFVEYTGASVEYTTKYGFNITSQNTVTAGKQCVVQFELTKK